MAIFQQNIVVFKKIRIFALLFKKNSVNEGTKVPSFYTKR